MYALPTKPISDAQIKYNELSEGALQKLIAARNLGDRHEAHVARMQYDADIAAARAATGVEHFMLVNIER